MEEEPDLRRYDPIEAADVLGVLDEVGLKGPKLAACEGQHVGLARQVAERLGVPAVAWHEGFIKGQIDAAVEMLEVERRVEGQYATPAMQRILDATEAIQVESRSGVKAPEPDVIVIPRKGKMGKVARHRSGDVVPEGELEDKVLATLIMELENYKAPVLAQLRATMNPKRALMALYGKYRISTVRRYLGFIQHLKAWLFKMDKVYGPMQSVDYVDYMYAREEEGMGPSIPLAVYQALTWFEKLAGIDEGRRVSTHPMVGMVVKDLTRRLQENAPPIRRAPRWPACFVEWLEFMVISEDFTSTVRLTAWMKLLKLWAAMRFDDAANLRTESLRLYEGKLAGVLRRTKTTGAGKRVRELPIFVSEHAFIRSAEWLETGFKLANLGDSCDRKYVFFEGIFYGMPVKEAPVKYPEMVAAGSAMFRAIMDLNNKPLFPDSWERFWTEHSERATLPSAMAALEVQKVDRDLLGRWCPEGSDQYIRTYNTVISRMQHRFAEVVRSGKSHQIFDEGGIYEDLKVWMTTHWKVEPENASAGVEKWKEVLKLQNYAPVEQLGRDPATPEAVSSSSSSSSSDEEPRTAVASSHGTQEEDPDDGATDRRKMRKLDVDRRGGFIVVSRRLGRGTLHKLGAGSCWMARRRGFTKSDIWESLPEPELYSSRCKLCWPQDNPDESGGSTSDSLDEAELMWSANKRSCCTLQWGSHPSHVNPWSHHRAGRPGSHPVYGRSHLPRVRGRASNHVLFWHRVHILALQPQLQRFRKGCLGWHSQMPRRKQRLPQQVQSWDICWGDSRLISGTKSCFIIMALQLLKNLQMLPRTRQIWPTCSGIIGT